MGERAAWLGSVEEHHAGRWKHLGEIRQQWCCSQLHGCYPRGDLEVLVYYIEPVLHREIDTLKICPFLNPGNKKEQTKSLSE